MNESLDGPGSVGTGQDPHEPLPDPPVLTFVPAMYYGATVRDDNPGCVNYGTLWDYPELYSNGGRPNISCGLCGHAMSIMSATLLDPQPIVP
ncbi:hypothetical protein [Streptomyces sp. NPDC088730]|uniref:hypothetical protein n=1 Tax=Streptomyces sp. NPDC088730 TaxID=3365877 RepID=UPI003814787C